MYFFDEVGNAVVTDRSSRNFARVCVLTACNGNSTFTQTVRIRKPSELAYVSNEAVNVTVVRASNNIPTVKTTEVGTLNVYDIVNAEKAIVTKAAIAKIEEVYA